ncbi:hypothetical protein [Yinghuangia soli]|uniref:LPXTG cell wall anchor domain-containing protein n=1 Tax=Yinghuangia soli TaxID=2908204 RepID=A0AA41Q6M6_9ACTN|nr:hypothetical protein [Yinghuangia soli]MCF2532548.1 hypothetical protein [Yinghuangia soli]
MTSRFIAGRWAVALTAPVLALSVAVGPASAVSTYDVPLNKDHVGIKAEDKDVKKQNDCPTFEGQNAWHFVLTNGQAEFVELTVTFEPGGTKTITQFGPPSAKHAYVGAAPGAKLVSATAKATAESKKFNVSHVCLGTPTNPPTTPPATTKPPKTEPPTTQPPSTGGTKTPPPTTEPPSTGGTKTPPPSGSVTPSASESVSASGGGSTGGGGGSLAQTGGIAVGGILALSAGLVGVGYYVRRRAAGSHEA